MEGAAILTTAVLVREWGIVCRRACSCCGKRSCWEVTYPNGETAVLCSWCDLPPDVRWAR